jgi:hypothetical protein
VCSLLLASLALQISKLHEPSSRKLSIHSFSHIRGNRWLLLLVFLQCLQNASERSPLQLFRSSEVHLLADNSYQAISLKVTSRAPEPALQISLCVAVVQNSVQCRPIMSVDPAYQYYVKNMRIPHFPSHVTSFHMDAQVKGRPGLEGRA